MLIKLRSVAQALYRKWRPQTFDDVVGQEHVTSTLKNQIATGRIGHAYLCSSARAVAAKPPARASSPKKLISPAWTRKNPRTQQIAQGIAEGRSLDLIEIDAASNNSVDDVREIRDKVELPAQRAEIQGLHHRRSAHAVGRSL